MTSGASKTALQGIYDAAIRNREVRAWKRRQRPSIGLYDGDWAFRGQVVGEYSASFDWKLNDTGAGQIVLPYDHHLALWAMSFWKRGTSNVHVRVDKDGERWTGRLSEVVTEQDEDGERVTTLNFLHDYEELKHLPVWANPLTPAFVQFPKTFLMAGPSAYILKLTLFLNLVRLNMSLWQLPDDPLSFSGWTQGLNYKEWPVLVKPGALILDDSQWTIINSRFKNFHDLAEPILADGHLMVEMRRWFNGDPQPWPGAGLYRDGQLIIDIVDKSGWFDETAVGGTIAGGLLRTGLNVAENLIDETRMHLNRIDDAPEYEVAGWLGIAPKQPWVTYRTNGDANTAESTSFTWQPATVSQITTGGHSSPGVNEAMSVSVQLAFNLIGSFMLQPGLGSVADSVLQPLYEDTLFAFMSFKSPFRTMRMGWSHYYENFESGGDKAYTLSSVIAMRKGFWDTRERTLHQMKIGDGAPYLVGANGEGHFSLGDRVGGEIPGPRDGRVVVEQVTGLSLSWDTDTPHEWVISTGDMSADHDPIEYLISKVRDLSEAAQDLGVM